MARINFNKIGRSQIPCQIVTSKNIDPKFSDDNKFNLIFFKFGLYKTINYVHNNNKIAIRNFYYSPVSNTRYHSIGHTLKE